MRSAMLVGRCREIEERTNSNEPRRELRYAASGGGSIGVRVSGGRARGGRVAVATAEDRDWRQHQHQQQQREADDRADDIDNGAVVLRRRRVRLSEERVERTRLVARHAPSRALAWTLRDAPPVFADC